MRRRFFGLALGLVAGGGMVSCSTSYAPDRVADAAGGNDGVVGHDSGGGSAVPPDADVQGEDGGVGADADASIGASTTCPATPPPMYPAYVHPPLRSTPCSAADRDAYAAYQGRPYTEQRAAMASRNASCAGCVFTKESDATWGPVTQTSDGRAFVSFGLCYAYAGASDACGAAAQRFEWCNQKVCNICLTGQNFTDCAAAARSGVCKTDYEDALSACDPFTSITTGTCRDNVVVMTTMCGGGT